MVGSQVTLNPANWNEEAAALLAGAAGNDPTYSMSDLQNEVQNGVATLYEVLHGAETRLGYVVLWVEDIGQTKELIIQSGAALARSDFAVSVVIPAIAEFARSRGCLTMRAHTNDKRMMRRLLQAGFHKAEVVVRMVV